VDRGGNTYIGMPLDAKELEKDFKVKFDLWKGPHEFEKGIWLTGEIPITNTFEKMPDHFKLKCGNKMVKDDFCDDNALVVDVRGGMIIVTGCGHRGIVNIVTYVKKVMGKRLVGLLGGTHLHEAETEHKDEVIKSLKKIFEEDRTKVFAPAHCTGFDTIHSFGKEFKDILKPAFCGTKFEF
jgi:7,8-dihydropterin-6-yl-methyl-4-(beta-D-ribofuranosyl)aminobenzene 5'-phosphate synthase